MSKQNPPSFDPTNDPDQALSKAWGKILEEGRSSEEISDPLFKQLLRFKAAQLDETKENTEQRTRVWNQVQSHLAKESTKTKVHSLPKRPQQPQRFVWLAAAILFIAALGLWLFIKSPEPFSTYESFAQLSHIELPDGSKITLRPYSRLEEIAKNSYKLHGEGYFQIIHQPERSIDIQTQFGQVHILGTTFTLSSREDGSNLYLYEGLVRIENERDTIEVQPTQAAVWTSVQTPITLIEDADESLYADWREGLLRFNQQKVSELIPELEQQYNIQLILTPTQQNSILSGSIRLDELDQSLNYLALLLGGRFEKIEENVYRFIED